MKVDYAATYYGSLSKLAARLDLRPSAVSNWKARHNGIIPELYARRLHDMTRGRLKFDPDAYAQ